MIKTFLKNIIIVSILSSWFGGIVFFYDCQDYQATYMARKDQAALNLLKNSEIYEENANAQAISTNFPSSINNTTRN